MSDRLIGDLIEMLAEGEQLCLLPIARVLVEDADWLSPDVGLFPPESLQPDLLRVVSWPEHDFQQSFGRARPGAGVMLGGDALHWSKSGATRIDLPDFFASALLAFPVALDWDAFLAPSSHEAHLDMLAAAMERVERVMDLVRFEQCNAWTPQKLPGRAGLLAETNFCAGLFYAPRDHESYIIAGQILTHQIIAGIGLDLTGHVTVEPLANGDVGSIARHALRLYGEALEAGTETSRFVQMMSLIEFLADPAEHMVMAKVKKQIGRQIARDRSDYDAIMQDFFYLSSEGGTASASNRGLRHNIVHRGKRLEELVDRAERVAVFKRLSRYAGAVIQDLRAHSAEQWNAIEALRSEGAQRLGLIQDEAR